MLGDVLLLALVVALLTYLLWALLVPGAPWMNSATLFRHGARIGYRFIGAE